MPRTFSQEALGGARRLGRLDGERNRELAARLLSLVAAKRTQDVLLDLTGLDSPDVSCAHSLVTLARALALMGTRTLLTGCSPALARVLVELDVELAGLGCVRNLRQGLERCRERRAGKPGDPRSSA